MVNSRANTPVSVLCKSLPPTSSLPLSGTGAARGTLGAAGWPVGRGSSAGRAVAESVSWFDLSICCRSDGRVSRHVGVTEAARYTLPGTVAGVDDLSCLMWGLGCSMTWCASRGSAATGLQQSCNTGRADSSRVRVSGFTSSLSVSGGVFSRGAASTCCSVGAGTDVGATTSSLLVLMSSMTMSS